jgi:hypothetical protein
LKSDSSYSDYQPWVFLYLPIITIYSYALYVLVCAKQILKKGIPVTFLHRVRTLDTSTNMLTIFSGYYAGGVILGILTSTVKYFWPALIFTFSTKAFLSLFIFWLMEDSLLVDQGVSSPSQETLTTGDRIFSSKLLSSSQIPSLNNHRELHPPPPLASSEDQASLLYDLNHALQHEVVTYATVGIQQCAMQTLLSYQTNGIMKSSTHSTLEIQQAQVKAHRNFPLSPSSQFPRTFTSTTTHSQYSSHPWNEHQTLQILIPQDLFVIDLDHFESLAKGTLNDLHNALKTSSQTMTMSALKSILQTKFLDSDLYTEEENIYLSDRGTPSQSSRGGHLTIGRPSSWNVTRSVKSEEKGGALTDELIDPERSQSSDNVTVLPLSHTNLLSQMRLHVKSVTRQNYRGSETLPRSTPQRTINSFLQSCGEFIGQTRTNLSHLIPPFLCPS